MPSPKYLNHATAQHSDDINIILLRLSCPDFPDWADLTEAEFDDFPLNWDPGVMYFANNTETITSRGKSYIPWMFDFVRPSQGVGASGSNLRFENLDRRIGEAIKLLPASANIQVTAETILAATPDIVEESFPSFRLNTIKLQELSIEAQLSPPNDSLEPYCSFRFTPSLTPGVFPQ